MTPVSTFKMMSGVRGSAPGLLNLLRSAWPEKISWIPQRGLIGRFTQLGNHRWRQRGIFQPNQGSIIGDVERIGAADRRGRLPAANGVAPADVDR